jgi:hypothetical protein
LVSSGFQHDTYAGVGLTCCSTFASLYSASTKTTTGSASAASPLLVADSSSTSLAELNLVVDFSSYPLQQGTILPPSLPASSPLVSKHPIVLRPRQLKTVNLVASVAAVPNSSRVMLSPTSKPIAFSNADMYVVWHDVMYDEIKDLHSNHTWSWSLVPFHPSLNVVGSR